MKAKICDVCGKIIEEQSLWERYVLWQRDSTYYKDFPKRLDICHDCYDQMKKQIKEKAEKR